MSSILDALKKLDRERHQRHHQGMDIEKEILRPSELDGHGRGRVSFLTMVFAGGFMLLAFLGFFLWQGGVTHLETIEDGFVARHRIAPPDASSTGRLPAPLFQGETGVKKSGSTHGSGSGASRIEEQEKPLDGASRSHASPASVSEKRVDSFLQEEASGAPSSGFLGKKKPIHATGLRLSVSGIAYGEALQSRLAIVNGQPLAVGESVEGIKIVEITEEEVRFFRQGRNFTLRIGDSIHIR